MTKNSEVLNRIRIGDLTDLRTDDFGVFDMLRPELERFVAPFKSELLFLVHGCYLNFCFRDPHLFGPFTDRVFARINMEQQNRFSVYTANIKFL